MTNQTNLKPLPWFWIGREVSSQRVNNFVNNKYQLLSDELEKPDTRSIWYSKDHIAGLLDEIEHAGGDGLRIYFGAYDMAQESVGGQMCLVMTPTREFKEGNLILHKNVVLEKEPDFYLRSTNSREMILPASNDDSLPMEKQFNYGSPCPPLCEGIDGLDI